MNICNDTKLLNMQLDGLFARLKNWRFKFMSFNAVKNQLWVCGLSSTQYCKKSIPCCWWRQDVINPRMGLCLHSDTTHATKIPINRCINILIHNWIIWIILYYFLCRLSCQSTKYVTEQLEEGNKINIIVLLKVKILPKVEKDW